MIEILSDINTGSDTFETQWYTPYSLTFILGKFINLFFSIESTGRILLSLYFIFTPLSFLYVLSTLGQRLRLGLFIFPILYNFNLSWGFIPFLISVPLLFLVLGVCIETGAGKSGLHRIGLPFLVILLLFTHLFSYLIAVILVTAILISSKIKLNRRLADWLLAIGPSLALGAIWYSRLTYNVADEYFLAKSFKMVPLSIKLKFFSDFVLSGDSGYVYRIIFWILTGLLVLNLFPLKPEKTIILTADKHSRRIYGYIIGCILVLLYLICPYSMLTAVWLFNRLSFLVFAGIVLMLPQRKSFFHSVLDFTVIGVMCLLSIYTANRYLRFEQSARPCIEILDQLKPDGRLRMILLDNRSEFTDHTPFDHIDQYYQIRQDGIVHNPFAVLTHMPVRYKQKHMALQAKFRPEVYFRDGRYLLDRRFDGYDYFLIRFPVNSSDRLRGEIFQDHLEKIRPLYQNEQWMVFETIIQEGVDLSSDE